MVKKNFATALKNLVKNRCVDRGPFDKPANVTESKLKLL